MCVPARFGDVFLGFTNGEFISVTLKILQTDMDLFLFSKVFM